MSWVGTRLYIDVAPRPTRSRRLAPLSIARLQSAGAGSGLETKRSALGAHLYVDTYSYTTAPPAAAVSQSVSVLGSDASLCQNTKYEDVLTRVHSARLFAARPKAATGALGRLGPTPSALHSARLFALHQTTTKTLGLGVCSNLCHSEFVRTGTLSVFIFSNFTQLKNAIGSESEGSQSDLPKKQPLVDSLNTWN